MVRSWRFRLIWLSLVAATVVGFSGCGGQGGLIGGGGPGSIFLVGGPSDSELSTLEDLVLALAGAAGPGAVAAQDAFGARFTDFVEDQDEFAYLRKILNAANDAQGRSAENRTNFEWSFRFENIDYTMSVQDNGDETFDWELTGDGANSRFSYSNERVANGTIDKTTLQGNILCDRLIANWYAPNGLNPDWTATLLECDDTTTEGWIITPQQGRDAYSYFLSDPTGTTFLQGELGAQQLPVPLLEGDFAPGAFEGGAAAYCDEDDEFAADLFWFNDGMSGDGQFTGDDECYTVPDPGDFFW